MSSIRYTEAITESLQSLGSALATSLSNISTTLNDNLQLSTITGASTKYLTTTFYSNLNNAGVATHYLAPFTPNFSLFLPDIPDPEFGVPVGVYCDNAAAVGSAWEVNGIVVVGGFWVRSSTTVILPAVGAEVQAPGNWVWVNNIKRESPGGGAGFVYAGVLGSQTGGVPDNESVFTIAESLDGISQTSMYLPLNSCVITRMHHIIPTGKDVRILLVVGAQRTRYFDTTVQGCCDYPLNINMDTPELIRITVVPVVASSIAILLEITEIL